MKRENKTVDFFKLLKKISSEPFSISVNDAFTADTAVIGTVSVNNDLLEVEDNNGNILIGNLLGENLRSDGTADENIVLGHDCLQNATRARRNYIVGRQVMQNAAEVLDTDDLNDNIAIGTNVLRYAVDSIESIAIGDACSEGFISVPDSSSGQRARNVAIGWSSLRQNVNGRYNVAIGGGTLSNMGINGDWTNTDQYAANSGHTAIGFNALQNNDDTSASRTIGNTAVGYEAANNVTTGEGNVSVGYNSAVSLTTGSNNTILGNNANTGAAQNGCIVLGAGATATEDNVLVLGSSGTALASSGDVTGNVTDASINIIINGDATYAIPLYKRA